MRCLNVDRNGTRRPVCRRRYLAADRAGGCGRRRHGSRCGLRRRRGRHLQLVLRQLQHTRAVRLGQYGALQLDGRRPVLEGGRVHHGRRGRRFAGRLGVVQRRRLRRLLRLRRGLRRRLRLRRWLRLLLGFVRRPADSVQIVPLGKYSLSINQTIACDGRYGDRRILTADRDACAESAS